MQLIRHRLGLVVLALCLLVVTVFTQSQTITSMVQTRAAIPGIKDIQSGKQKLQLLLEQMNTRLQQDVNDYEAQLLRSVLNFQLGKSEQALADLTQLTEQAPSFHLAHLVRADMLAARVMPVTDIGTPGLYDAGKRTEQLKALREEAMARLLATLDNVLTDQVPVQFLELHNGIKTALLVDKSHNRLYVFERSHPDAPPKLQRDFYVSTGRKTGNKVTEGDLRTPEGVYFITSWIPDDKLPEKYGIGAFPTNYPNALDRHLGKTGDGIWLHGTDRIYYSRPPLDSEGCVVMANAELSAIRHLIVPGVTPIVIADNVQWVDRKTWRELRTQVKAVVEKWRTDWESLNVDHYLDHYGHNFWTDGHTLDSWTDYKRRVAAQKTSQQITLKNLSLFYYPREANGNQDLVVARFRQDYKSNNFSGEVDKHLYLERQQDSWKIIYEGK